MSSKLSQYCQASEKNILSSLVKTIWHLIVTITNMKMMTTVMMTTLMMTNMMMMWTTVMVGQDLVCLGRSECSGSCWDSTTQPTHYSLRLSPLPASTTPPYLTILFVVVVVRVQLVSLPNHCNILKHSYQVAFIGMAKLVTVALCKHRNWDEVASCAVRIALYLDFLAVDVFSFEKFKIFSKSIVITDIFFGEKGFVSW